MNIVIVDSGVSDINQYSGIHFFYKDNAICKDYKITDNIGHGTAICNIIKKHCIDCNTYIIKIFDSEYDVVDERLLNYVLNYIYDNIECNIINMSLGLRICKEINQLKEICRRLDEKGVSLVSAFDNEGGISFPAAFSSVIGVSSSKDVYNTNAFKYVKQSKKLDVIGYGKLQRVCWLNNTYKMVEGNSFACAHITGLLAKYFAEKQASDCSKKNAKIYFQCEAQEVVEYLENDYIHFKFEQIINSYDNVVVFPFNKEMHSLIRYQELLPFHICDVYDTKYSCRVGLMTNEVLNIELSSNYCIKNFDSINWNSFDTIIIGHIRELINIIDKREQFFKFLFEIVKRKKNIYALDSIEFMFPEINFGNYLLTPSKMLTGKNYISENGMMYVNDIPVIGVLGTSSKQGKFTLQLGLRDKLIKNGYKIGQLGTEPTACLFNMDEQFHFGYDNRLKLDEYQFVSLLNQQIHSIQNKSPDIIIVGSQGSTVTTNTSNLKDYSFSQMEFLLGTLPDAVVLCINTFDDIKEINRTIAFIESIINSKVIALAVFPTLLKKINEQEYKIVNLPYTEYSTIKKQYEKIIGIKTIIQGYDADINMLVEYIIDFFAE